MELANLINVWETISRFNDLSDDMKEAKKGLEAKIKKLTAEPKNKE